MHESRPHLRALTGLRFVAAFQVLAYHGKPLTPGAPGWLRAVEGSGYVGVGLFFVLSGFVLTYTYHDALATGAATRREFLAARVARLYPVYLLALLVALPPLFWLMERKGAPVQGWWLTRLVGSSALLVQAWDPRTACMLNCPAWSLSVEAFFYLAFLLILPVLAGWRVRRLLAVAVVMWALVLAAPLLYMALRPEGVAGVGRSAERWMSVVKYNPLLRLPEFVLGIIAGRFFLLDRRAARRRDAGLEAAAALAIVAVLVASARIPYLLLHNGLLAPAFAVLVYALARGAGPLSRVLSTRVLTRLGAASYALYILHVPLGTWLSRGYAALGMQPPQQPWHFAIYAALTITVSLLVFRWVEEPARRALRRRLAPPRADAAAGSGEARVASAV
jgi:peptidoglycan/LPS O-acetylase OafA/YrhL